MYVQLRDDRSRQYVTLLGILTVGCCLNHGNASSEEYRLLEDLLERKDGTYNPKIRPVENLNDTIEVGFEMALIQLINLDEKNQVMKTNVWLRIHWCDSELHWKVNDYGGSSVLRISPDKVWKPDVVLLNNADGRFEVSFKSNILVYSNGKVMWIPCTIYKSSCNIDVTYFPFDEQSCEMIYGSWTYNSQEVKLKWYVFSPDFEHADLANYVPSGQWDLVDAPAIIETKNYSYEGYSRDQTKFTFKFRRKTLYYTVNLIMPCVLISILSMVVFYLPSDAGEKVSLGISILLALVVFLQVLVTNLLPPSSTSFPLFAKFLLFTVIMDGCAILNAIMVLNWNFKTPRTHKMPRLVRKIFFGILPKILLMHRPANPEPTIPTSSLPISRTNSSVATPDMGSRRHAIRPIEEEMHHADCPLNFDKHSDLGRLAGSATRRARIGVSLAEKQDDAQIREEISKAAEAVRFIAAHLKNEDDYDEVIDDWRYIAFVLDRLLLYIYCIVTICTMLAILLNSPQIFLPEVDQLAFKQKYKEEYNTKYKIANAAGMWSCPWDESEKK